MHATCSSNTRPLRFGLNHISYNTVRMIARHPVTGKPVRVAKTETHIYKNQKTLAILRSDPSTVQDAQRFKRWETLAMDIPTAELWRPVLDVYPSAICVTQPTEDTVQWLREKAPREKQLLFLSKAVIAAYGREALATDKFVNVLCLEEFSQMYPHIQHQYESTESEAVTALSIGAFFRVARVVGFTPEELADETVATYAAKLNTSYGLQTLPPSTPEPLWFLTQFYQSGKSRRQRELEKCLKKNIECEYIDGILLLTDSPMESPIKHNKVHVLNTGHRLQYADIIRVIQDQTALIPNDAKVCFANSDIYLDDTWQALWSIDLKNTFLSLLRYEESQDPNEEAKIFGPRPDSQDTWVLRADDVRSRQWKLQDLAFEFGRAGCDNAVNIEMLRHKFVVANPALTLKTYHVHASEYRTYNPNDVLDKQFFLYLDPTGLHDLEVIQNLAPYQSPWTPATKFSRRVNTAEEATSKTFCTMLARGEEFVFEPTADNTFVPPAPVLDENVYILHNAFTLPNGLVYGYSGIYMGKQPQQREAWAATHVSHVTPSLGVKSNIAAPLTDEDAADALKYIQNYMARILRLKTQGFKGDMMLPRKTPRLHEFLQCFKWDENVLPVVPRDEDMAVYAEETVMLTHRKKERVYKEDVEVLRTYLRNYQSTPSNPRKVVIFQDDDVITSEDTEALEKALEAQGYEVDVVYPSRSSPSFLFQRVCGAAIAITPYRQEHLFWMLPSGAKVIEVMPELKIRGEGCHTAGAASLEYWVVLLQRAKKEQLRPILVEKVLNTVAATSHQTTQTNTADSTPVIVMPTGQTGYHAHSGDSFREMATIWAQKGYVRIEKSTETPFVWLGGVGETLLYDRANLNWIRHTNVPYKRILCGNPNASQISRGVQWNFWPRRPTLVEAAVTEGKHKRTYAERTQTMVFYGRVENALQGKHRSNNLHVACDEYECPLGDKPYKFGQEEYLDKLASAKFGLCLAGYGSKCNREVECLALGTVPVVAPDVDMDNYASPLTEGVHYIRLKSFDPQSALQQIKSVTEADWALMSAAGHDWWQRFASAEGLWHVTKALVEE